MLPRYRCNAHPKGASTVGKGGALDLGSLQAEDVLPSCWGVWYTGGYWDGEGSQAGSTGTGCPGRLWSLLLWRYSRPAWTRSSTTYCRWPCFGRRVGLDDPQRSLPTPTILWFCDSGDAKWGGLGQGRSWEQWYPAPTCPWLLADDFSCFLGVGGLRGPVLAIAKHPRGQFWEWLGRERSQSCARLHLLKIAKLGLEGILKGVSRINTIILIITICIGRTTVDLCGETQSLHCLLPHVCRARWAAANPSTWWMILFFLLFHKCQDRLMCSLY